MSVIAASAEKQRVKTASDEPSFDENEVNVVDFESFKEGEDAALDIDTESPTYNKSKSTKNKGPSEWVVDDNWFAIPPQTEEGVIPASGKYRVGKNMNVLQKYKVWIGGKRIRKTSVSPEDRVPADDQTFYNWNTGSISFPRGSQGKKFRVEFYIRGQKPVNSKGKDVYLRQSDDEEYAAVHALKNRSSQLWFHILNSPDPDFTISHIIPRIEDELDHMRSNNEKNVPELTGDMMKLEHLIHRTSDEDSAYTKDADSFVLEDPMYEVPPGSDLLYVEFSDSKERMSETSEDPEPGEYLVEDDAILFSEEDTGLHITVVLNKPSSSKEDVVSHIKENIAPKLMGLHSLAVLVAESVLNNNAKADDEVESLPGMENGIRSLDPKNLSYAHKIRRESNGIENDLREFAKYHMPKLARIIQSGSTYNPRWETIGASSENKDRRSDFNHFKQSIRPIFEKADLDLTTLLHVALNSFLQGVLEFDYDKRNKDITDPKKFKVASNPKVWANVITSLRDLYNKYKKEHTQSLSLRKNETIVVPEGGGEVNLRGKNIDTTTVVVQSNTTDTVFKAGGGLLFRISGKRGGALSFDIKKDTPVGVDVSPYKNKRLNPPGDQNSTEITVKDTEGNKFERITHSGLTVPKEVKNSTNKVFYFSTSSGKVWVPVAFEDTIFEINLSGKGSEAHSSSVVNKNSYVLNGKPGVIEFSPLNGGEEVYVGYIHSVTTTRMVTPSTSSPEDEDEEVDVVSTDAPSGGQTVEDLLGAGVEGHNAQKIVDYVESIVQDPSDTRLSDKEKVLLAGVFGIGTRDGSRLSIREIAKGDPFNLDVNAPRNRAEISKIGQMAKDAAAKLAKILRDKVRGEPELQDIMKSRSFKDILSSGWTQTDKVLSYLKENYKEDSKTDPTKRLRGFLGGVLTYAKMSEDEENVLRYAWGIHGPLRRDDPDTEDDIGFIKNMELTGGEPVPIPLIADQEFGIDPKDLKEVATVRKTYRRALQKFEKELEVALQNEKLGKYIAGKRWARDFLKFYRGTSAIYSVGPKEKEDTKVSIFDQIRESANAEDEEVLRDMLVALDDAQKKGKTLTSLIDSRTDKLSAASKSELNKLYSSVSELHSNFLDATQNLSDIKREAKSLYSKQKALISRIRDEADADTSTKITELATAIKSASDEEKPSLQKEMRGLLQVARATGPEDVENEWRNLASSLIKNRSELKEWTALAEEQRKAIDSVHKNPLLKAQLELDHLNYIRNFFVFNDDLDIGDGKYILNNLFDSKEPADLKRRIEEWEPKFSKKPKSLQPSLHIDEDYKILEKGRLTKEREKGLADRKQDLENRDTTAPSSSSREEEREQFQKKPGKRVPEKMSSLFNQLVSAALPRHGEADTEEVSESVRKFKALMTSMMEFVASGDGTVTDFINDPGTSSNDLLPDEGDILGSVKEFLLTKASDLQIGEGNWDLTTLFSPRVYKDLGVDPDEKRIPMGEGAEALNNAQNLSIDESKVLHSLVNKTSRGLAGKDATGLKNRLDAYRALHPEDEGLEKLYSGENRFPSREEGERRRPLRDRITPFVESLSEETEGDTAGDSETKTLDMLSRMGDLAEQGLDLNEMSEHFIELDTSQEAPYSLAYLFQRVRNYLYRLNRSVGLQNTASNYGLDKVFPSGAEYTPTDDSNVGSNTSKEYTEGMLRLIKDRNLSEKEAELASKILQGIQAKMVASGTPVTEILRALNERDIAKDAVRDIAAFLVKNRTMVMSDFPGFPDLSPLTGIPFTPPESKYEDDRVTMEEPTADTVTYPGGPVTSNPDSARTKKRVKFIRDTLKKQKNLDKAFNQLSTLLDSGTVTPDEVYQAVMSAGLPPKEVFRFRELLGDHEEEGMGIGMPEPQAHGISDAGGTGFELDPDPTPEPTIEPDPISRGLTPVAVEVQTQPSHGRRGRLPKKLAARKLSPDEIRRIRAIFEGTASTEISDALDRINSLETINSYNHLKQFSEDTLVPAVAKMAENGYKSTAKRLKKAWILYYKTFTAFVRAIGDREALEEPTQGIETPEVVQPAPAAPVVLPADEPAGDRIPLGKEAIRSSLLNLPVRDRSHLQKTLHAYNLANPLFSFHDMTLEDLLSVKEWADDPVVDKFVDFMILPSAPKPVAPVAPVAPVVNLEALKARAIEIAKGKNWSATKVRNHIRRNRPDLADSYEKIKDDVAMELKEISSGFDDDLSDL